LLLSARPFPDRGKLFLVNTGLPFLARDAEAALGSDRLVLVERYLDRLSLFLPLRAHHASGARPSPGDSLVLAADKQRRRLFLDLERYAKAIGSQGRLLLFGRRREGMLPAENLLRRQCRDVETRQGGRIRLIAARPVESAFPWPLERPDPVIEISARGRPIRVRAMPGLFSWDRLDEGSALLLETARCRKGDRLLDLACGNGVLAAALLAEGDLAEATLADADALALEAARETLALNGLRGEVLASDAGANLPAKSFDLVLCNPPYHRGRVRERETGRRMIESAARTLGTRGRLLMVAPVFHDHGPELERCFRSHGVEAETSSYRVWRAARPRRASRSRTP